jgi:hypothetical protein
VLLVERIARDQRSREFRENLRQKTIVQMNHRLTPIIARSHQLDGDVVGVGVGVELRVPAKNPQVSLVCWCGRPLTASSVPE